MELKDEFEAISRQLAEVQKRCNDLYVPWASACEELRRLERQRNETWQRMIDAHLTGNTHGAHQT